MAGVIVKNYMSGMNAPEDITTYEIQMACIILCYIGYVLSINHLNKSDGAMRELADMVDSTNIMVGLSSEVETSNENMVDNMKQIKEVMGQMNNSVLHSEETTKTMLSKYEETLNNVVCIEKIVGKLMEELGGGGFMGLKDTKAGMKLLLLLPQAGAGA